MLVAPVKSPGRYPTGTPVRALGRPGDVSPTALSAMTQSASVLDGLLKALRAGESRVLVVHGEPGVGKTVLLDYLAGRADGCRVLRVAGVQAEMELAFAGLYQLCAPLLGRRWPGNLQLRGRTRTGPPAHHLAAHWNSRHLHPRRPARETRPRPCRGS